MGREVTRPRQCGPGGATCLALLPLQGSVQLLADFYDVDKPKSFTYGRQALLNYTSRPLPFFLKSLST